MTTAVAAALPTTLEGWLARCDQLHPKEIDLTLDRVKLVRERLGIHYTAPLITVAGTNGKGSTCAMLESIAVQAGYHVGLYSKPHLVHFEERCRIDGRMVEASALLPHFAAVEAARGDISLTYFEFTLLAIAHHLATLPLDLLIFEVGLGGRLDAVNAFDPDCAVLTCIDIDHAEFLGPDRESIGLEKAGIMRRGRPVVVSDPMPPQSVLDHAAALDCDLWRFGRDYNYAGDQQQWSWSGRHKRYNALAYPALRGANQLINAAGALAVFEVLNDRVPITAQAVRNGLAFVELQGRFQIVPGQPTLVLDVAHNPHAVATLVHNLDHMGYHPRTHVVFGAMRDKAIDAMLRAMAPIADNWLLTDLPLPRAATAEELQALHAQLELTGPGGTPATISRHANPVAALAAAKAVADPADRIVVFGSFYTVGGVLADGGGIRAG